MYWKVSPLGDLLPINVNSFNLGDLVPENMEIRAVAAGLQNDIALGSGWVQAEHFKTWLRGIIGEEKDDSREIQETYGGYLSD